jgi:hypothetical protein
MLFIFSTPMLIRHLWQLLLRHELFFEFLENRVKEISSKLESNC